MQENDDTLTSLALDLGKAERDGVAIDPLRDRVAEIDNAAYRIQKRLVLEAQAAGRRVVGHKIGLTARAVQSQLGVSQPDYGAIFADRLYGDNAIVDPALFIAPRIEAEVAFLLGDDLAMDDPNWADVLRATAFVMPSIEIVDSRIRDWDIGFDDTVADNASFGACILGGPAREIADLDLSGAVMALTADGKSVASGSGAACLGNPINAVVWLAKALANQGDGLKAGDIVLSGALGPMVPATPGTEYRAEISGLGHVTITFGETE